MNLRQLRYLCEITDQNLNLSAAAKVLHTSQPGISKQIKLLEEELGIDILVRRSNRIVAITSHGASVLELARRVLRDANNIKQVGKEFGSGATGTVTIATTHAHGRYLLLPIVVQFRSLYPSITIRVIQANSQQISRLVADGVVDIGVATHRERPPEAVIQLPFFDLKLCLIVPNGHPLLKKRAVGVHDMAEYPFVMLDPTFAGGHATLSAFAAHGIVPHTVVTATDSDVIKAYVEAGIGIATLPEVAFDAKRDKGLRAIAVSHLFPTMTSSISMQKHSYLRNCVTDFIALLAPRWTREAITRELDSSAEET